MFSVTQIQQVLEQTFPGAQVSVRDTTGTSDHFEVRVVAPQFEGKKALERHRMVYQALGPAVGGEIHALSLKAFTPQEAERN